MHRGPAFHSDFKIILKHELQALAGASVKVQSNGKQVFAGTTSAAGSTFVHNLPPGNYWIDVELLGISAASHCFHVAPGPNRGGKRQIKYEWGDFPARVKYASGQLLDSRLGSGASVLLNCIHRVQIPITGSTVTLISPFGKPALSTTSDEKGNFELVGIANGLYVLQIQGGKSNRDFDVETFLVRLDEKATGNRLRITKQDAGGGSCSDVLVHLAVE